METEFMTNEYLIKNLCERADKLWLADPITNVSCIAVAIYLGEINQAWFVYYENHIPIRIFFDYWIGEGNDLRGALLDLESYLAREEEKQTLKLEKQNNEYLMAHRELIMSGIGFGD